MPQTSITSLEAVGMLEGLQASMNLSTAPIVNNLKTA